MRLGIAINALSVSAISQMRPRSVPAPTGIDQTVKLPGTSFIASEDSPGTDRSPPRVGEHTDEILAEIGYTDGEIAGFHDKGVV